MSGNTFKLKKVFPILKWLPRMQQDAYILSQVFLLLFQAQQNEAFCNPLNIIGRTNHFHTFLSLHILRMTDSLTYLSTLATKTKKRHFTESKFSDILYIQSF